MKINMKLCNKLEEYDNWFELLRKATEYNTRFCTFEEKENMQNEYYQRRSLILHALQMGDEKLAIERIDAFLEAIKVKTDFWMRTKVTVR